MEKTKTIRHKNIWINVFSTPEGGQSLGIRRSYPSNEGWKYSNFLRPDEGDLDHLMQALVEYMEWKNRHVTAGCPE